MFPKENKLNGWKMIRNSPDNKEEENIPDLYIDSEHEITRKISKYFPLFTTPGPLLTFLTASYLTSLLIYELGND